MTRITGPLTVWWSSWNVGCQSGYVAEESIAAMTDIIRDKWETSGCRNHVILGELVLFGLQ